jgi:putative protein kinase ArgK-like GTPase of G3E family
VPNVVVDMVATIVYAMAVFEGEHSQMSKRHFIALADALRAEKPQPNWNPNKLAQWELDVKAVANVCAASNSAFKRDRWMDYVNGLCGPNGGAL